MKKNYPYDHIVAVLLALIFFVVSSHARAEPIKRPLFYEMAKGDSVVQLFGTYHLAFDLEDVPMYILMRLAKAPIFLAESDVVSVEQSSLPVGQSLKDILSPAAWSELKRVLDGRFPTLAIERLKPVYAAVIYSQIQGMQEQADGEKAKETMLDSELGFAAKHFGAEIHYLDNADLKERLLQRVFTSEVIEQTLTDPLFQSPDQLEAAKNLRQAYVNGDVEVLLRMMNLNEVDSPDGFAELTLRHRDWLADIERFAGTKKNVFVAVGGGHLLGPEGIVAELKKRGYIDVSPYEMPSEVQGCETILKK